MKVISAEAVAARLGRAGLDLPADRHRALAAYIALLQRWNRVYNLTGVRDPAVMVDRHLLESLALKFLLRGNRIADVGSGAGLPGIPLAIVEPERQFMLIESRAKRVHFLRHVIGELHLTNTTVAHCRVEDLAVDAPFDTVLARAVVGPEQLAAITHHVTGAGSILLLLTAAHVAQGLKELPDGYVALPIDEPHTQTLIAGRALIAGRTLMAGQAVTAGTSSSIAMIERTAD